MIRHHLFGALFTPLLVVLAVSPGVVARFEN